MLGASGAFFALELARALPADASAAAARRQGHRQIPECPGKNLDRSAISFSFSAWLRGIRAGGDR
jgi:hypothetical protein